MKKVVKAASAFLSAAILSSTLIISASAEETLSTKVTYKDDGTAVLMITSSDWNNYVYYTTDGSVPTEESMRYFTPLEITEKTTIRIAEFEDGKKIKGIKKTVKPKTAPISFFVEQDYDEEKAYITLECETLGAKIYYTTDGSKPSEDSSLYLGPVEIDEKTKIRARAYCDGFATKTTYSKTVKVEEEPEQKEEDVEVKDTKTTSDASEITNTAAEKESETEQKQIVVEKDDEEKKVNEKVDYRFTYVADDGVTYVNFMKQKSSNIIYYTVDGSAVSKSSKKYTKRVKFKEPGIIRAKEYTKAGKLVATLSLNVKTMCKPVEYSCVDFASGTRTIAMSTKTEGATIYYTTDGTAPDVEYASVYSGPIVVGNKVDISAIAVADGYRNGVATYVKAAAAPLVNDDFDFSNPIYKETAECFNSYRNANGVGDLILDEDLTLAAFVRAKELSVIMDHIRPNGTSYVTACSDNDINVRLSTEFIASRFETPQDFFDSILETAGNKRFVLNDGYAYNKIGIGYYEKADKRYWVAILAWIEN